MKRPVIVIHGGAGSSLISAEKRDYYHASLTRMLNQVYPELRKGLSAVEAAAFAVELLENDPAYNAGKGSKIQSDGKIRMSASIMNGPERRFAGCINVEGVKNPVRLAQALLDRHDRVLSGAGAKKLARELGLPFGSAFTPRTRADFEARRQGKTGTVGAVVLDRRGALAAATSTGGRGYEYPHRVSDSATSAGNYATAKAAVSATGTGERIVDFAAASTVCAGVEAGLKLKTSVSRLLKTASKAGAKFGLIAVDRRGEFVAQTTTKSLIWAAYSSAGLLTGPFDFG